MSEIHHDADRYRRKRAREPVAISPTLTRRASVSNGIPRARTNSFGRLTNGTARAQKAHH